MLAGKNIIVTGCLSETGRQTMVSIAENGANLFACARECTEDFESYCKSLEAEYHVQITPLQLDVESGDDRKSAIKKILDTGENIHGLVNAEETREKTEFGEITKENFLELLQKNVIFPILFTQDVSRLMIEHKQGSIVFVSNVVAFDGKIKYTPYAASMAALLGAMRSMAKELGSYGVRVNAVATGAIEKSCENLTAEELLQSDEAVMTALKRMGKPREVADVLLFLMSDMSSHITGQTIRVDGGMR